MDPASPLGMGLYLYRFGNDPQSLQTMDRLARMGSDAGIKWTREEFNWERIEIREGEYDWSFYDNLVKRPSTWHQRVRLVGVLVAVDRTVHDAGNRRLLSFCGRRCHAISRRDPALGSVQ